VLYGRDLGTTGLHPPPIEAAVAFWTVRDLARGVAERGESAPVSFSHDFFSGVERMQKIRRPNGSHAELRRA
jgi:hypothetical protein